MNQFNFILLIERVDLPVAGEDFQITVVSAKRNVESYDSLTGFDEVKPLGINFSLGSARLEEELNLLEEAGLVVLVVSWTSFLEAREVALERLEDYRMVQEVKLLTSRAWNKRHLACLV